LVVARLAVIDVAIEPYAKTDQRIVGAEKVGLARSVNGHGWSSRTWVAPTASARREALVCWRMSIARSCSRRQCRLQCSGQAPVGAVAVRAPGLCQL